MQDILQDIVSHTHGLGFLTTLKISTDSTSTSINSITENRGVILFGTTHDRISDFDGIFGMGNLDKLNLLLKSPEYKEDATIKVLRKSKDDEDYPAGLYFENVIGDFKNEYKFINKDIIEKNLKSVRFKGAQWGVEFEPPVASITRMKLMSAVHSENLHFNVKSDNDNIIFSFGDSVTHEGEFVFKHKAGGSLTTQKSYPVQEVQSILSLSGNSTISISDTGVMKISVDSGLATYDYIIPCQTK